MTAPFREPAACPPDPPPPLEVVAVHGGYAMADDGRRIVFVNRGTTAASYVRYGLGIMALCAGINAVEVIARAFGGASGGAASAVGAVIFFALCVGAYALIIAWIRRRESRPIRSFTPLLVIDRNTQTLTNASGWALSWIAHAYFFVQHSLLTNTYSLVCITPRGGVVVASGGMFSGGFGDIRAALKQRGLRA